MTLKLARFAARRVLMALNGVLFLATPAQADDPRTAEQLFKAAQAAYERGDFRAAAVAFGEAYRRAPNAAVAYNMALSYEAAGDAPRACDALALASADQTFDEASRKDADARLQRLLTKVDTLTVSGPKEATFAIEQLEGAHPPAVVHLAPGAHTLRAEAPGFQRYSRTIRSVAGGAESVTIELVPIPPPPKPERPTRARSYVGFGLLATGAVATIASGVLAVETTHSVNAFQSSNDRDAGARSDALTLRTAFYVTAGVAAATAVTGLVVILLPRHDEAGTTGFYIRDRGLLFETTFR